VIIDKDKLALILIAVQIANGNIVAPSKTIQLCKHDKSMAKHSIDYFTSQLLVRPNNENHAVVLFTDFTSLTLLFQSNYQHYSSSLTIKRYKLF
jgi:hypothetical protein